MKIHSKLFLAFALISLSCQRSPEMSFAPPPQHKATKQIEEPSKQFFAMNDDSIAEHIVRDVSASLEGVTWRWTFEKPELRIFLRKTDNLALRVDFATAEATLRDTGQMTISFLVNEKNLDSMRCSKPGNYSFVKAVPDTWLNANSDNIVTLDVRPLWVAPDGKHLGVILIQAGFVARYEANSR